MFCLSFNTPGVEGVDSSNYCQDSQCYVVLFERKKEVEKGGGVVERETERQQETVRETDFYVSEVLHAYAVCVLYD